MSGGWALVTVVVACERRNLCDRGWSQLMSN